MTRRPTASTALPAIAAALALALSACGGGGGGGGPSDTGGQSDSPPQTGTDSTPTPPATPDEDPERPATPATTTTGGGGGSGGSGGSGTGGQTRTTQTCPDGSIIPANATCPTPPPADGPLTGIPWDHDNDGTTPDEPYAFKASYTIPEDDTSTEDVNEREVYITEIQRDADYADQTAQDIGFRIDAIREGTDTGGTVQGAPLADWTDAGMVRAIIVKARGVSGNGLDADAVEDIEAIDELIKDLADLKDQAEMAKEALETARAGEEPRLRSLVATLRSRAATLEREIAMHEADAAQKDTDADERADEINGADPDYDGPTIESLTSAAEALNIDFNRLVGEITDHEDDKALADAWIVYYDTPEGDRGALPSSYAPCGTEAGEANCRANVLELANDIATKTAERDMKQAEETTLRARITALQREVTDLRAEAQRLRDMVPTKRTDADRLGQEASDLEGSIDEALAALQTRIDTIQGHIDAIGDKEDEVKTRHDTDRGAANPNVPALRVQEGLITIATQTDPATPLATHLVRRTSADITGLYENDDGVFARAARPGITADAAMRAIVRAAQPTIPVAQFVDEFTIRAPAVDTTAEQAVRDQQQEFLDLAENLGEHWRMRLTGYLLADTDLDATDRQTGTDRGDSVPGTFRGVHGTFYCNGSSCGALTAATFGSGWFFTPSLNKENGRLDDATPGTDPRAFRYRANAGGTYRPLHFADYGMWLEGDRNVELDVQARAALIGPDSASRAIPNLTSRADGRNRLGFDSATYSGTAHGLSARSRYEGSEYVTASGHFTADVELNATFGGTPTLGGTIDNFRSADTANQGGGHVNPAWSLDLHGWSRASGDAAGGLGTFDDGDADTDETARGHWSAWGHGAANARPDGFYGGFTAAFRDDAIDQAPNGTNGDGSQDFDGNLFDDGAAIGVFGTTRDSQ